MRVIDKALVTALSGDVTLAGMLSGGIHRYAAPQGTAIPYGIIRTQSPAIPRYTQGGQIARRIEALVYLFKVVFRSESASAAKDAVARADAVLNDAALLVEGHTLRYLRRESGIEYEEAVAGVRYQHIGNLYRIEVEPS